MNEKVLKAIELINKADAIIIGAGAGLSTSAGINYGIKGFKETYPELFDIYGFTDFYTSSFYHFQTEEERWSYWAKHIYNLCIAMPATKTYKTLYNIIKDKNYFVITTNTDKQFEKSGFDSSKVFEVQGSLTKIQCSNKCHNKLYDNTDLISQMIKENNINKIPSSLIPYCPVCNETMDINIRKDNNFVEDEHWHHQNNNYYQFLNKYKDKNILFIEIGVGFNTPGIIRFPFEKYTYSFSNSHLIRINSDYPEIPTQIQTKSFSFKTNASELLETIEKIK